jgi:hypothetical protein
MKPPIQSSAPPEISLSSQSLSIRRTSEASRTRSSASRLAGEARGLRSWLQRLVQQCLLMVPLATACAGTAAVQLLDYHCGDAASTQSFAAQ